MASGDFFGVLAQYPSTTGHVHDLRPLAGHAHAMRRRLLRGGRPAGAHAAGAARRMGRRHRAAAPRSASACRWATAARTRPTWPAATSSSARCRAGWSASASTRTASPPTGSRCRRASSTSAARRPLPTSARRRCCRRWWPACTRSTTGPQGLKRIAQRVAALHRHPGARAWSSWAASWSTRRAFDTLTVKTGEDTPRSMAARAGGQRQPAPVACRTTSASRSTRPPRAPTSRLLWALFVPAGQPMPRFDELAASIDAAHPRRPAPHQRLPHAPGVQHPPQRDRRCCATSAASPTRTWRSTAA